MRSLIYVAMVMSVFGLAFWAYQENYKTQAEIERVKELRYEISDRREAISVLTAEWAYLNRPDRLRELADLNFDRLGLLPLHPDQFGRVDQVAFPPRELLKITNPVDVSSAGANP